MPVPIAFFSTIYMAAFIQALLMIIIIIKKERVLYSEKYLIAVLGALSMTLISYVGIINQWMGLNSVFVSLSAIAWQMVSPLLYLYTRSLIGYDFRWSWKKLVYFPFSIIIVVQLISALIGMPIRLFFFVKDWNTYNILWILTYLVNSLFFSILTYRLLIQADLAEKHRDKLRWLIAFFKIFSVILVGLTALLLWWLNATYFFYQLEYILLLVYAVFIFSLIGMSLRFSHYFSMLSNDHYGHDQKDEVKLAALKVQLLQYFEEHQPYLSPKLSLTDLSKSTGMTENQISQIFTRLLKSSFYQFVNEYRLKEFERQIELKGTDQYTIMALANSAGFASKATFYKLFKAHYQMTPSEFIKQKKQ